VSERTGVAPPLELAAVLAPSRAEATVLKAAPPSEMSLMRVRLGACTCEFSLTPPSRHPRSVESMAGRFADWKRAQASFKTRPRSLSSLMLLAVGFRETCSKSVPPNYVDRPGSCVTFPGLKGFFISPPLPEFALLT
jgi:hypothetical protein